MNDLLERLFALTGALTPAKGVTTDALERLREWFAAWLIQETPGYSPVQRNPSMPAQINQAALDGERLAAKLAAAGTRIRFTREPYLAPRNAAERAEAVLGPFVDDASATLVQFALFRSVPLRRVIVERFTILGPRRQTVLLLPWETVLAEDGRRFDISAGSAWLHAGWVAANGGVEDLIGLRIQGGALRFENAVVAAPESDEWVLPLDDVPWKLSLVPEAAPGAAASGSIADRLGLQLPRSLELALNEPATAKGDLGLYGFGSELRLDGAARPVTTDAGVLFPYDVADLRWQPQESSPLIQLSGEQSVKSAGWLLPFASAPIELLGEANHGGVLVAMLENGSIGSRVTAATGAHHWGKSTLRVDAQGWELTGSSVVSTLILDIELWRSTRSRFKFGNGVLSEVRLAGCRDGVELVELTGGRLENQWDLPCTAASAPFPFTGDQNTTLGLVREKGGRYRTAFRAELDVGLNAVSGHRRDAYLDQFDGFALENLFLQVHPIRTVTGFGSGPLPARVSDGHARLFFDVRGAQPILPDPYAANWTLQRSYQGLAETALRVDLAWSDGEAPAMSASMDKPLHWPHARTTPPDASAALAAFRRHLHSGPEELQLLDLSTREHLFGIAFDPMVERSASLDDGNRLSLPLHQVRLLMQPQVHWEPLRMLPNPRVPLPSTEEVVRSKHHGGATLLGVHAKTNVAALPSAVCREVATRGNGRDAAGALFSLPFGLRAFARMDSRTRSAGDIPPILVGLHAPRFDGPFESAQQIRLTATGGLRRDPLRDLDAARGMPGGMWAMPHLVPGDNGLTHALPQDVIDELSPFEHLLPIHQVDLSGYGLSMFSHWRRDPTPDTPDPMGVVQVRFDVLVGRTAYEVIELKSILAPAMPRAVRTVIFERTNAGMVQRFDSGWNAIEDGYFQREPVSFHRGAVVALRNIRNIRILPDAAIAIATPPSAWQPVVYDADAEIVGLANGTTVPVTEHPGYIAVDPTWRPQDPPVPQVITEDHLRALFEAVGHAIGGPLAGRISLGDALSLQLSGLYADLALDDDGSTGFAVAVHGSPDLPQAGQWSTVRIEPDQRVTRIDQRRGVPVVRRDDETVYRLRDATDALRSQPAEHGLLMAVEGSRVLFPKPTVDLNEPQVLRTAPPFIADPQALSKTVGEFPPLSSTLACVQPAHFAVASDRRWLLGHTAYDFDLPIEALASGSDWAMRREFPSIRTLHLGIDSAAPQRWNLKRDVEDDLKLTIAPFGEVLVVRSGFNAASDRRPGLNSPTVEFGSALKDLREVIDALDHFIKLPPGFDVDINTGDGPNPSLQVRMSMRLRLPPAPNERIDIGVGKFCGQFDIIGKLQSKLDGQVSGQLKLDFAGDVQQGIIPPLLYAGGLFRFGMFIDDNAKPLVEMGLGTTASIGGDLIKGLIALEVTVSYGYRLIPETLQPAVMLGLEARAKLLSGLVGVSFSAHAVARIQRLDPQGKSVTIWAELRVIATIEVLWGLGEEEEELVTQFEQKIPLAVVALAAGAPLSVAAAIETM